MTIAGSIESKIPFSKIDVELIEKTQSEFYPNKNKDAAYGDSNLPEGIIKDSEYRYCYQNLLIEANEWTNAIKLIL